LSGIGVGRPRFGLSINVDEKAEMGASSDSLSFVMFSCFISMLKTLSRELFGPRWGFRTMPISIPGQADHSFRDDGDHDSGMMPITRSGMIPIS
jgi:hypothetical protein